MAENTYSIRGGAPADFEAMASLTEKVFNDPFVRKVITQEKTFRYKNARLLFDETGRLASTVFVIPREMYMDGITLKLGGIGGVATDPVHRGKGFANVLMKDAVDFMIKEKYDLSILYPFKSEYYAKFGYRDFIIPFGCIYTSSARETPAGYTVREFEPADIPALSRIYDGFNAKNTGPVKRALDYWRQYIEKNKAVREAFFVAEKNKKAAGYAIVDRIRSNWGVPEYKLKITEIGAAPGEAGALDALAAKCALYAAGKGFKKIFFDKTEGFDYPGCADAGPKEVDEHRNLKYIKMYKIISIKSLLRKMTKLWDSRLKNAGLKAGWSRYFSVSHTVTDYNGRIGIIMKETGLALESDEGEFTKLLLGLEPMEKLAIAGKEKLSEKEKEVLRAIFPLKKPVYWDFDYL
jgi:predicted acetyltransferase